MCEVQPTEVMQQILHVIKEIKNCDSYKETKIYFDTLQETQEALGFLFFNNKISLSPELRKFVRDCDRLDDEWLREHLFEKIKTGIYSLSSDV